MKVFDSIKRKALLSLTLTFGILFAAATALIYYLEMPLAYGFYVSLTVAGLQYLLGPFIIEMLFEISFERDIKDTDPRLYEFLERTCSELGMPMPKIGIIDDGNPNAFTYGHIPRNARIVVTTGLIDLLTEEELEAVAAHELGHIKNYDFILMTIVSVIPMLLYQIYAFTNRDKGKPTYLIGLMAYGAYIISQYAVLFFSRVREYYADNFSVRTVNSDDALGSALVKIAYGFVKVENKKPAKANALGVVNNLQSQSFVLNNYKAAECGKVIEKLINWDIKSIWGRLYELSSTHPLTAKRIMAMKGKNIENRGISFKQVSSFAAQVFLNYLPHAAAVILSISSIRENFAWRMPLAGIARGLYESFIANPVNMAVFGAALLIRYYYIYGNKHQANSIEELLMREDASPIKGIPAVLEGTIVGRGIPGLFYSEDLIIDDGSGIMLLDYKQPLRFLEFLFGTFLVEELIERKVKVVGWYRRANRPYFLCKNIVIRDKKVVCYPYLINKIAGYAFLAAGLITYIFRMI